MSSDRHHSDTRILHAWADNAAPWTRAVREHRIDSRERVTNRAIIDAVLDCRPATAIDLGCGEGWLTHALCDAGVDCEGVDAIPALIDRAREGRGRFHVAGYEAIAATGLGRRYDAAICNFSLLGDQIVANLLRAVPALLNPSGVLVIQTLHPLQACGDLPYRDGWRDGSWAGIGEGFAAAAPWYFRTLESWIALLRSSGLQLRELREPLDPQHGRPASALFIAGPVTHDSHADTASAHSG
jgi:2-polyprenyl-3-methyl-5-hydroxy-6-metoxy-1,4-benzoquinol methylase